MQQGFRQSGMIAIFFCVCSRFLSDLIAPRRHHRLHRQHDRLHHQQLHGRFLRRCNCRQFCHGVCAPAAVADALLSVEDASDSFAFYRTEPSRICSWRGFCWLPAASIRHLTALIFRLAANRRASSGRRFVAGD